MEKYAVIMAGGTGSRLWPLSRENRPKQFICVEDGKCMLLRTAERICEIVPAEKCFVITNKKLLDITRNTLQEVIPSANIIAEPSRKNTAACIAYASLLLKEKIGSGLLCFIPADGHLKNNADYKAAIEQAYRTAESTNSLVVIGIAPTYPATGYGYIHIDAGSETEGNAIKVERFVEKPDLETAQQFVASGEYLWNSGIVLAAVDTLTDSLQLFLPGHYDKLTNAIKNMDGQDDELEIETAYNAIPDISFDKGVLEKSGCIYAVKGYFDWDDIGSLDALAKTFGTDTMGNSVQGRHLGLDTSNSVVYSDQILVATIGVENMIIAFTKDAVLVCPRNRVQDVKTLVEMLKINGYEELV